MQPYLVGHRFHVIAALIVALTACSESTSPPAREQDRIFTITVPARAAVGDTIRIGFLTASVKGCNTDGIVEIQSQNGGIRFSATSVPRVGTCPPVMLGYGGQIQYVVLPPHVAPYTVSFAEPGGADSVRVIAAQ